MSDAADHGITVTEIAAMDQPIDAYPETTAAFVGRALRGPLNKPILIRNFGDFRRHFGDVWHRSSLGPAVQLFFEHGGSRVYVVRVANDARGATISLPAGDAELRLTAVNPGSAETIRAAVDYDDIDDHDDAGFNLTVQRINAAGLVEDQEIYRRVGCGPTRARFVGDALLSSELARVSEPLPAMRPDRTVTRGNEYATSYTYPQQQGTDGVALTNYDLIGSSRDGTGLFALEQVERLDILYLPPPGKGLDIGPTAVLAAERYCHRRGAMLIVDPCAEWRNAHDAVFGIRDLGYASSGMLTYFPRIRHRGDDDARARPAGAAIAGLLCRHDKINGPWHELSTASAGLRRDWLPVENVHEDDIRTLLREGINVFAPEAGRSTRLLGGVTLGRGTESDGRFIQLSVRRCCLQIIGTVARATRWAVFEADSALVADRIRRQLLGYFERLADAGAFSGSSVVVQCDAGVCERSEPLERGVTILLVFQPLTCSEPISVTLHQTASGCRVGSTAFGLTDLQL